MTRYQAVVLFLILLFQLVAVWEYRTQQRRKGVKTRAEWQDERARRGVPKRV